MNTTLIETRECEVCREDLLIVRESSESEDRVVALDKKDHKKHVCFDLPQDANLLVMEDNDG